MATSEYRSVLTQRIIEQIKAGTAPWLKPWDPARLPNALPVNAVTNRPYHGGNRLWLDCQGFSDSRWCTYKQAQTEGWQVRKGERASVVEYWQWHREELDATGSKTHIELDTPRVFYAHVFNVAQIDGAPELNLAAQDQCVDAFKNHDRAERLMRRSGAAVLHDQLDKAFYQPHSDNIHLPPKQAFTSESRYYATAVHELGHWTGHETRLNRDLRNTFGTGEYAREELRAELASYFTCSQLGLAHDPDQHASYINSWVNVLQQDFNEIFRAARDAEHISEYLLPFSQEILVTQQQEPFAVRNKDIELGAEIQC